MSEETKSQIAVILVRGKVGLRHDVLRALDSLNLMRKHACTLVDDSRSTRGALIKVKDFATFGPVSAGVVDKLKKARKPVAKNTFSLHPPRGGWEKKGIKVSFNQGGALGERPSMDSIIERMI